MDTRTKLSDLEYEIWRELVHNRCGIYFTPSRLYFLESRLWERMQAVNLNSYSEYYHYVLYNSDGDREWGLLLDLLLNNESSFFRHTPSFAALMEHIFPDLLSEKRRHGVNMLSMWSAGCANGQEAYSLAMAFHEVVGADEARLWQMKVWGTDISRKSMEKARNGRYKSYDIRNMPDHYLQTYMELADNGRGNFYKVNQSIQRLTQFAKLNLMEPNDYWISEQDIIFCQNVLIYFQLKDREALVRRLCGRLSPGGYLFLAPAEMVGLKIPGIRPVKLEESLIYQKVNN